MKLQEWIRWARGRAEPPLTQADLGEILHCTKANVSGWENDYHQPSFEQVLAIASACKVPLPHQLDELGRVVETGALSEPALQIAHTFDQLPDGREKLNVLAQILGILHAQKPRPEGHPSEPKASRRPSPEPTTASLLTGNQLFVDAVKHVARQVLEIEGGRQARGRRRAAASSPSAPAAPKPTPKRKAKM